MGRHAIFNPLAMQPPAVTTDLSTCDTWPVHAPGAIQPFGYLIAVDPRQSCVTHWSENWRGISGGEPVSLTTLFAPESAAALMEVCKGIEVGATRAPTRVALRTGEQLRAVAHRSGESCVLVEFEAVEEASPDILLQQQEAVASFAASLEALDDPQAVCEAATGAVHALTGYDRVMIYRFHPDLHGEVIAESKSDALESWLGLHYPATDIPAPARAVFEANKVRMIPDVSYAPVAVIAADGVPGLLDLTRSLLRSVSPIHIEYLHNMRVTASLTLSIKQRSRLWGLVACHHYRGVKLPGPSLRGACAVVADYLSAAIALKAEQQTFDARRSKAAVEAALRTQIAAAPCVPPSLCEGERHILELMSDECCGAAVASGATVHCVGVTPSAEQVQGLVSWLRALIVEPLFVTDWLGEHFPPAREFAHCASGVLALVPSAAEETTVLWFKPETVQRVTWGGNPEKPVDLTGMRLHPRKSFAAWLQTVRGRSMPWQQWEIELASSFLLTLAREQLRRRVQSESQARAEAERANRTMQEFIATISHDLRDPLSSLNLSLLLLNKLLSADSRSAVAPTLGTMERAVAQMTGLVRALLALSAIDAGGLKLSLQPISASELLDDCAEVLRPLAAEKRIDLFLERPSDPVIVRADRDQLLQVCSNLVGNALKYTPAGGRVEVRLHQSTNQVKVEVVDSGPGVGAADLPHVFDRFYRARVANTRGVGLGLAIAKGIVEAHGGTIGVRSEPGKGATFWFVIPRS